MSELIKYVDSQKETIMFSENEIEKLKQELEDTKNRLKHEQMLLQGREIALQEVKSLENSISSLLRDLCSVLPLEALDLLEKEFLEIIATTKENYQKYSQSDRFLNVETKALEDSDLAKSNIKVALPEAKDDTTYLTSKQLESIISSLEEEVLEEMKSFYGVDGRIKKIDSLALAFSEKQITMLKLGEDIKTAQQLLSIKKRKQLTLGLGN